MENQNQDLVQILMSQATLADPVRYAYLLRASKSPEIENIRQMLPAFRTALESFEIIAKKANEFRKQVSGNDYSKRRKDAQKIFDGLDQQRENGRGQGIDVATLFAYHCESMVSIYTHLVQGSEMIANARMVSFDESMDSWTKELSASTGELGEERIKALFGKAQDATKNALDSLAMEQQINRGASTALTQGLLILEKVPKFYENYLAYQARNFENYFERLRHRHSTGGMSLALYEDTPSATLTDIALLVWENIDRVGEIESGTSRDELSAYTLHRAEAMIDAARNNDVWQWLIAPGENLISWAAATYPMIKAVLTFVIKMKNLLGEPTWRLQAMEIEKTRDEFIDVVKSLDLSQITQRPPERAFSKTEKFALEHRNKSVQTVASLLIDARGLGTIVDEILKLKVEERNFFVLKNSFYVCTIGQGNVFTGEAPGALQVIPGEKPHADLRYIWGSGFDDIRDHITGMGEAKKWNPLFLSTSPSGSTDKNNILLVGPQGCGKTQVMRAMGAANDSIAIFAVGSSFLTCWLGEAQKNPARLFDEAVKLHKSSGRPVHILIDEIDSVLNDEHGVGTRVNLSTEFQNLMDGVQAYPGISVWGATNHPNRIPTPMLRRFAKVMVVGELSPSDTKAILKHYIENFLPSGDNGDGFSDEQYDRWAKRFEGATGDLLRKMVDEVWLTLMRNYIKDFPEEAEKVLEFLKQQYSNEFDISMLTDEDRVTIRKMIGKDACVTAELVDQQAEKLLNNFAIQQQIQVSKETYRNAKLLLDRQKAGNKGLGFS